MKRNFFKNSPLYLDCLQALNIEPLEDEESNKMHELFKQTFPITKWGKIDWVKIDKKTQISEPDQIISSLKRILTTNIDETAYIDWSDGGLPIIKTTLTNIINNFDDIYCLSFEKFIFNPLQGYIIEIRPGSQITIGVLDKKSIKE